MRAKAKKYARIYYSEPGKKPLFWRVRIHDAKQPVKISSTLLDALKGVPGSTVGCHLSNCAVRNSSAFPHPVLMASFTKTAALIVTTIKDGAPKEAVRYRHSCAALVRLNDTDKAKIAIRKNPKLANRSITLSAPSRPESRAGEGRVMGTKTGARQSIINTGALGRAVDAGLVSRPIAKALAA